MAAKPHIKSKTEAKQSLLYAGKARGWMAAVAAVFVLIVFCIHPFYMDSNSYFAITEAKQGFFRFFAISFFVVVFLISITIPGFYKRPELKVLVRSVRVYEWPLLAFAAVMLVSSLFADSTHTAFYGGTARNEGIFMIGAYMLAAVLVGRLLKPREWTLYALCASAALVGAYGVFQYYGLDFLGLYPPELQGQVGQAFTFFATMSNRNVASTYFSLAFCVSLAMFSGKTKPLQWLFLPLALILFYALLIGRTESGYVGLILGVALTFPFFVKSRQAAARFFLMLSGCLGVMWLETTLGLNDPVFLSYFAFARPYLPFAALLLLVLAAALYFIKLKKLSVSQKAAHISWFVLLIALVVVFVSFVPCLAKVTENASLDELASILQGDLSDSFMSNRMLVWKRAASMIPDRLLLGHGPDNFNISFNAVYKDEVKAATGVVYDKLHNEYLQTLFDNGLLGLLSMLGFYGALLFASRKKLLSPPVLGMTAALLCFMAQAFFNFVSPFAHPVAWTLWGVLGAFLYNNKEAKA